LAELITNRDRLHGNGDAIGQGLGGLAACDHKRDVTLAVCLLTRDEQDGRTCIETAMVAFAEPAMAAGEKGNTSNTSGM
jgi:hypothetical protein